MGSQLRGIACAKALAQKGKLVILEIIVTYPLSYLIDEKPEGE